MLFRSDLPNANPRKTRQELASIDEGLLPEEWGGKTGMIECSATTGQGVDALMERLQLEAEYWNSRPIPHAMARAMYLRRS